MKPGLRILHTADLHIGRTLYTRSLKEDQQLILSQIVDIAAREKVEIVVIAGDLFDRSVPSAESVQIAGIFLADLRERCGCDIVLIAGNHDSPERLDFLSDFLSRQGLHIRGQLISKPEPLRYTSGTREVLLYPIPYAEPLSVAYALGIESLPDHQSAWDVLIPRLLMSEAENKSLGASVAPMKGSPLRVLVGHCYVAGGSSGDSERPLSIGGSELVKAETFKDFDLVMLGHLHRPQNIDKNIRYSGSPIALGASEASQIKHVLLYTIDSATKPDFGQNSLWDDSHENSTVITVKAINLEPLRKLKIIEGSFAELCSQESSDYTIARLTDNLPIFEAFHRLQKSFQNLLHVEYLKQEFRAGEEDDIAKRRRALEAGDIAIISAFFEDMTGRVMGPEENSVVVQALEEIELERRHADAATQA